LAVRAWLLKTKTLPPPVRLLNATKSCAIAAGGTSQNDAIRAAESTFRSRHDLSNILFSSMEELTQITLTVNHAFDA